LGSARGKGSKLSSNYPVYVVFLGSMSEKWKLIIVVINNHQKGPW
jgi:hypothetical protein